MRRLLVSSTLALTLLAPSQLPAAAGPAQANHDDVVLQWNSAVLQAVRVSTLGPPMTARALAIVHTCMYDAWAAYDPVAFGTRYAGTLRRPAGERTADNKAAAISYAAYRAATDLLPAQASDFASLMARLGYDPVVPGEKNSPAGLGTLACQAVLDARHHDGANQLGDEAGGQPGVAYADYTGYRPANDPMDLTLPFDPGAVHDPSRWQPLRYPNADGVRVTQTALAPQWQRVTPFAMTSAAALRSPTGPAIYGDSRYRAQALALVRISAHLTDKQKTIASYWADGPGTVQPPGHWNLFAQDIARREHHHGYGHGLDDDVTLFFALANALLDASIVAWDNKRAFDSVRPITAIRYLYHGQHIRAWAGPGQGTQTIDGGDWLPYQKSTFPTPPFPEYASGHSTFSAAAAEILRLSTGSDHFDGSVTIPAGSSDVEPGLVPAHAITLHWATFTDAADQAGLSRRYGGIHFEQADHDARAAGRACANAAWAKARQYIDGTAA
jgi:hypothetical protein